jgi:hypothetical protein
MTLEEAVLQKLRTLPPENQQEVLDYIKDLESSREPPRPRRNLKGLCADLGIHITEQEINEAREEMWGSFPRDVL